MMYDSTLNMAPVRTVVTVFTVCGGRETTVCMIFEKTVNDRKLTQVVLFDFP